MSIYIDNRSLNTFAYFGPRIAATLAIDSSAIRGPNAQLGLCY